MIVILHILAEREIDHRKRCEQDERVTHIRPPRQLPDVPEEAYWKHHGCKPKFHFCDGYSPLEHMCDQGRCKGAKSNPIAYKHSEVNQVASQGTGEESERAPDRTTR